MPAAVRPVPTRHRAPLKAWAALAVYLAGLATVVFWPTPVDRPLSSLLERLIGKLHNRGLPEFIGYAEVEWMANVVLFMPFGALVAWLLPRRFWWYAIPLAWFGSSMLELGQLLLLPERVPSVADIAANTLGAAAGAWAAHRFSGARP